MAPRDSSKAKTTIQELECDTCPKCGYQTLLGAHFCTKCGSKLNGSPPAPTDASGAGVAIEIRMEDIDKGFDISDLERDLAPPVVAPPPAPRSARTLGVAPPKRAEANHEALTAKELPPDPATSASKSLTRADVLKRVRAKQSLKREGLANLDLSEANLEDADLARADLENANLRGAILKNANLEGANLRNADLEGADLSDARLGKADLSQAKLSGATLDRATLPRASLDGAELTGVSLIGAFLSGVELTSAVLSKAVLRGANLANASLEKAKLGGADLSGAVLSRASLVKADLQSVNFADAALSNADLSATNAALARFERARLDGTRLCQADLSSCSFTEADLRDAEFEESNVLGASFTGARVRRGLLARAESARTATAEWVLGADDDAQRRFTGEGALAQLLGEALQSSSETRYFGKGDVLKNALLEFGADSRIHVDGRFENCVVMLGDEAELVIGESGVFSDCQILGKGRIVLHGCFLERRSPGISRPKSLHVSSRGMLKGAVLQAPDNTVFAFEAGCRLRMRVLPPEPSLEQAAE